MGLGGADVALVQDPPGHGDADPRLLGEAGQQRLVVTPGRLGLARHDQDAPVVEQGVEVLGGGIDPAKIARRAVENGMVSEAHAEQMSNREILNLVFSPGFSTAETVTNVSGRGVGMDVVKNNIEKINGSIDVQSEVGVGSTIRIKIPLTLAIIPALIIRCAGDRSTVFGK